jgi:hypothetical protein
MPAANKAHKGKTKAQKNGGAATLAAFSFVRPR